MAHNVDRKLWTHLRPSAQQSAGRGGGSSSSLSDSSFSGAAAQAIWTSERTFGFFHQTTCVGLSSGGLVTIDPLTREIALFLTRIKVGQQSYDVLKHSASELQGRSVISDQRPVHMLPNLRMRVLNGTFPRFAPMTINRGTNLLAESDVRSGIGVGGDGSRETGAAPRATDATIEFMTGSSTMIPIINRVESEYYVSKVYRLRCIGYYVEPSATGKTGDQMPELALGSGGSSRSLILPSGGGSSFLSAKSEAAAAARKKKSASAESDVRVGPQTCCNEMAPSSWTRGLYDYVFNMRKWGKSSAADLAGTRATFGSLLTSDSIALYADTTDKQKFHVACASFMQKERSVRTEFFSGDHYTISTSQAFLYALLCSEIPEAYVDPPPSSPSALTQVRCTIDECLLRHFTDGTPLPAELWEVIGNETVRRPRINPVVLNYECFSRTVAAWKE